MVIQRNMQAFNANRQLNMVEKAQAESAEKLSSGYKINRSADDAAGLSISEKMRKQIRGLTRAGQNVEDGISLCQVIDGAMAEMHEMVNRMNELCVQAANGTNSESDRADIEMEIEDIVTEFGRIIDTTKFNELYVFKEDLTWYEPGNGKKIEPPAEPPIRYSRDFRDVDGVTAWSGSQLSDYFSVDLRSGSNSDWTVIGRNPQESAPRCAWIDLDGFTASSEADFIKQLDQRGFDSSCCHCQVKFYGIKFVSQLDTDKLQLKVNDVNFNYHRSQSGQRISEVLKIDLKDVWSRYENQMGKKLGQVICETLADVIKKAGDQPDSNLTSHLTSYAYEKGTARLYLLDNAQTSSYNPSTFSTMPRDDAGNVEINKPIVIMPSKPKKESTPRVRDFYKKQQIDIQAGADGIRNNRIRINLPTMTLETLGLIEISARTEELATNSINSLMEVQKKISEDRSRIGAYQNRMEHTKKNLDNVVENTTASESRIRDTDMADEMVRYANNNILMQAGQSVLSQANTRQQRVLMLLGA